LSWAWKERWELHRQLQGLKTYSKHFPALRRGGGEMEWWLGEAKTIEQD
jgi:hypothetical protein